MKTFDRPNVAIVDVHLCGQPGMKQTNSSCSRRNEFSVFKCVAFICICILYFYCYYYSLLATHTRRKGRKACYVGTGDDVISYLNNFVYFVDLYTAQNTPDRTGFRQRRLQKANIVQVDQIVYMHVCVCVCLPASVWVCTAYELGMEPIPIRPK